MNPFFKALSDFERIKQTAGRNAKISLLQEADSPEFKALLNIALNPYLTLGARVPTALPKTGVTTLKDIKEIISDLSTRNITGGSAQHSLGTLVAGVPQQFQPIFIDILNKEPRIGVDVKTANLVWPKFIPVFSPQLANDSKNRRFPLYAVAEPKFDGLRCFLCVKAQKCYILSRKGLPLYNADHVLEEVTKFHLPEGVYDGELFGKTFDKSVGTAHRSVSAPTELLYFHVFDYLSWEEWNAMKSGVPYSYRRAGLTNALKAGQYQFITLVEQHKVSNLKEALAWAKEWKEGMGLEGAVVKDLEAPYQFKRSDAWLKVKFTKTYDIMVVGVLEGRGKYAGALGKLACIYQHREVRVGSGLSDELRDYWWQNPDRIIGKIIEVEADADETHKGSLRFPRFVRVREDK